MKPRHIRQLAAFIEKAEFKFNMRDANARPACGSAGCIGGHAAVLWPEIRASCDADGFTWISSGLMDKLGITPGQHSWLCFSLRDEFGRRTELHHVTREAAVEALRHLAETGEVRFRRALCRS